MRHSRRALVLSLILLACQKPPAPAALPLLAHVPANTPYVFAFLEPVPRFYWERIAETFGKDIDRLIDRLLEEAPAGTPGERFAKGLLRELRGKVSAAGMKELFGIGPDARAAFYGAGIVPVLRLELVDDKALPATVERLAKEAGLTLPTATHGDRRYWRFEEKDVVVAIAVVDKQLVVAGGPTGLLEAALANVLGLDKPKTSMADGAALRQVRTKHGFGPWVGYVDAQKLLPLVTAMTTFGGPACRDALTALAKRFPRASFGYDEWTERKIGGRMILEMEPALAARLQELVVDAPGFGPGSLTERSLLVVGAGANLDKGRLLAADVAGEMARLGGACEEPDLVKDASEARAFLSRPLPPGLDKARGGLVKVLSGTMGHDGNPSGVQAFAVLAADDGGAFLDELVKLVPIPDADKLARDGKFHELVPAGSVPYLGAIHAAVQPKALAIAVGTEGILAAERALAATGKAPLFYVAYDYGRIMQIMLGSLPAAAEGDLVRKLAGFFGVLSMSVYPSGAGLVFGTTMEMN